MSGYVLHTFSSSAELAVTLACETAEQLRAGIQATGSAILVVSGGNTPVRFFHELSQCDLNWVNVQVLLADERWVPADAERSNAALVRRHLLRGRARDAAFSPLYSDEFTPQEAAEALALKLAALQRPFDAVILGLGLDGHTASLFPDAPELNCALSADAETAMVMTPASQPEVRLTVSARTLCRAKFLALHIEGAEKRNVFELATQEGPEAELPVRAILRNDIRPAQVYWCP